VPPCVPLTEEGSPTASNRSSISPDEAPTTVETQDEQEEPAEDFAEDDGFGEFDEFEEGEEGDDDFGDFDDGFQQGEEQAETSFDKPPDQPSVPAPSSGPVSQINTAEPKFASHATRSRKVMHD
jgi:hypothetical protein